MSDLDVFSFFKENNQNSEQIFLNASIIALIIYNEKI